MDSKVVSRELWRAIRPLLRETGWDTFTSRTARKFSATQIDVINFQSFNSYRASGVGCTTYSFSIRLGCFLRVIPHPEVKVKNALPVPEEYHCHLRCTLLKNFPQPECARTDVFYIDPDGKYLPKVIEAAREAIATEGFEWFKRFSDMREVFRTLTEDGETNGGTWGFGRNPSPARHLYRGYVALAIGETAEALRDLRSPGSAPSFERLQKQIERDISHLLQG